MEFKQARDLAPEQQAVIALPDVVTVPLAQEGPAAHAPFLYLLLCSDGLHNALSNDEVGQVSAPAWELQDDGELHGNCRHDGRMHSMHAPMMRQTLPLLTAPTVLVDLQVHSMVCSLLAQGMNAEEVCRELCVAACVSEYVAYDNVTVMLIVPART